MKSKYTGERLQTSINYSENMFEHLHRYALAGSICKGKDVLDIACGEGYGSALLSKGANKVTGIDISLEVIQNALKKYQNPNLDFIHGSVTNIPLPDKSKDVVVSFETIEHLDMHEIMLSEIKRVLKIDGILIISSPDKKYYTDLRNFKNEFHVKELYSDEFKTLISKYFSNCNFFFQKMISGSLIVNENNGNALELFMGNYQEIERVDDLKALYNVCIGSDAILPQFSPSIFYEDYNFLHEITVTSFKNSWRYRIGNMILSPFSFLKKLQ